MYFSRTFKALNFDFQIQGLLRTFKVHANPVYFYRVAREWCREGFLNGLEEKESFYQ